MKHLVRFGKTIAAVLVVALPALLVDPSFAHYVATHPALAAWLPLASALVRAVLTAWQERAGKLPGQAATGRQRPVESATGGRAA